VYKKQREKQRVTVYRFGASLSCQKHQPQSTRQEKSHPHLFSRSDKAPSPALGANDAIAK